MRQSSRTESWREKQISAGDKTRWVGLGLHGPGTQWAWDTVGLEFCVPGAPWAWGSMGLGLRGPEFCGSGTLWVWGSMDLEFRGPELWAWGSRSLLNKNSCTPASYAGEISK